MANLIYWSFYALDAIHVLYNCHYAVLFNSSGHFIMCARRKDIGRNGTRVNHAKN